MNEFLKAKNRLLIISFVIILLEYTQTTITDFKIMGISFELKEDYLINNFNTIFILFFFFYVLEFFSHGILLRFDKDYIEMEEKRKIIKEEDGIFYKQIYTITFYLTSFDFLKTHLTLIIAWLAYNSILLNHRIDGIYLLIFINFVTIFIISSIIFFLKKKSKMKL